jgi:hypothetical protein
MYKTEVFWTAMANIKEMRGMLVDETVWVDGKPEPDRPGVLRLFDSYWEDEALLGFQRTI